MKVNKNINILSLKIWLITMITLVSLIVFVGGLTRLTESGLSITVWEVFKGVFPPLNLQEWNNYFNDYKKIPEYKLLNTEMSLDEFKVIFYWEYSHRMLARLLGFLSIIPLIYFSITYKDPIGNRIMQEDFPYKALGYVEDAAANWTKGIKLLKG